MGLMDKAKFWKKNDDDLGDLSDLGDFGLDDKQGPAGPSDDLSGPLPSLDSPEKPGMQPGVPTHMEDVQPTAASQEMSDQLGLRPASPESAGRQPPIRASQPQQQMYGAGPDLHDLAKEIEIVHAKLDSIKATLDSINQRLATLERIASPDNTRTRYQW